MRNLFALVGFVVVVFLGLGWYLNWYRLDWSTGSDGRAKIGLDVDTNKVAGDLKTGADKAGQFIDTLKTKTPAEKAKQQAEDPKFVGPPIPADWPGARPSPAVGVPVPPGYAGKK
jgi:hypothetical protein